MNNINIINDIDYHIFGELTCKSDKNSNCGLGRKRWQEFLVCCDLKGAACMRSNYQ